jgi:hypothetical protein
MRDSVVYAVQTVCSGPCTRWKTAHSGFYWSSETSTNIAISPPEINGNFLSRKLKINRGVHWKIFLIFSFFPPSSVWISYFLRTVFSVWLRPSISILKVARWKSRERSGTVRPHPTHWLPYISWSSIHESTMASPSETFTVKQWSTTRLRILVFRLVVAWPPGRE